MQLRARLFRTALAVIAILILVPAFLLAAVQTGPGRRLIATLVERLASTPDLGVAIGGIEGRVPWDMTITGLALSDRQGQWLTIDRASIDWSPAALLDGAVEIAVLEAGEVDLERLPKSGEPSKGGAIVPDLPVVLVGAEAERVLDRALDQLVRNAARPVGLFAQVAVDEVDVEFGFIGADFHVGSPVARLPGFPVPGNWATG